MKNKTLLFIFTMLLTFIITPVYAETYLEMTDGGVNIRKGPSTDSGILGTASNGQKFSLVQTNPVKSEKGCNSGYWYKVRHNNQDAYICSDYAQVVNTTPPVITAEAKSACEAELKNAGFPETYWNSLCNLKAKYPAWKFEAVQTQVDFAAAVQGETCKCSISKSSQSNYQDTTCNKSYDEGYTGASQLALAYYMNPLNFLDEKNIFMFESNYKNDALQQYYATASKGIIPTSAYFVGYIPNIYNYIANATSSGVSATAIAARIRQEIGSGKLQKNYGDQYQQLYSVLSGNYTTRTGNRHTDGSSLDNYYNFYNIAAYDGSNVTHKALIYAKNHGWGGTGNQDADRQKAVTEGAAWIYRNYTNAGQETIYFNKFNVNKDASASKYQHQYMTNINAPVSEASLVYKGYQSAGALGASHIFRIPIYGNLGAQINNTPGGATGDTGNNSTGLSPSTMVISSGYSLNGTEIKNIKGSTNISDFAGRIISQGGGVEVYNGNNRVTDGLIGTGMKVKVSSSSGTTEFVAIVKGDPSGDGQVNALDLLQIKKYLLKQKSLTGVYATAADTSGDGQVNALDLLQVKKSLMGKKDL